MDVSEDKRMASGSRKVECSHSCAECCRQKDILNSVMDAGQTIQRGYKQVKDMATDKLDQGQKKLDAGVQAVRSTFGDETKDGIKISEEIEEVVSKTGSPLERKVTINLTLEITFDGENGSGKITGTAEFDPNEMARLQLGTIKTLHATAAKIAKPRSGFQCFVRRFGPERIRRAWRELTH